MSASYGDTSSDIPDRIRRQHHVSVETFNFLKNPIIAPWAATIEKPNTRIGYAYRLSLILRQLEVTPEQFLDTLKKDPDGMGVRVDGALVATPSKVGAQTAKSAIIRFARFYRVRGFEITVDIRHRRTRLKRPFTWEMAQKTIKEMPTPYREVFTFMLYGSMDENTFTMINFDEAMSFSDDLKNRHFIEYIKSQMEDEKTYVRIDLPPRKKALDMYFILVPKAFVPELPAKTRIYHNRGGELVDARDLQGRWRLAARTAKTWAPGVGPHKLRTAFRSRCEDLGLPAVGEWQMGHGVEKYGYAMVDDDFVLDGPKGDGGERKGGLKRLWETAPLVDRHTVRAELETRDREIRQLRERLAKLESVYTERLALKKE